MTAFQEILHAVYDMERPPAGVQDRVQRDEFIEFIISGNARKVTDFPTTAIAWDTIRTFGERDGRRLLLWASKCIDEEPLTGRQVLRMWWEQDYEPEAWVDERLIDLIGDWRYERDRLRRVKEAEDAEERKYQELRAEQVDLAAAAEDEWLGFNGVATAEQVENWKQKYRRVYTHDLKRKLDPIKIAETPTPAPQPAVSFEDFYAYLPAHTYIFTPTREMWPASSVNSRLPAVEVPMREKPVPAATWLDANRAVEQMTWVPGRPMEIRDKLIADGGWIDRPGCTTFNLYRAPTVKPRAGDASKWVDHVHLVFDDDAEHIIKWLAHRVQRPDQKINHALVLGGNQGIGKDTLLEPIKAAVGPWNFAEVSPQQVLGRFNGFVKSVVLRVSEARDLGDTDRYGFYEHMKALTAAPPDVLRVDEKHMREHAVLNVCGIIITTNNKDSLHLPSDDRRHFVAWSCKSKESFPADYWAKFYGWLAKGGTEIVAHYLAEVDLSDFDAKAPPPKTAAFWEIVDASRAPEDAEMADAIDALHRPSAVTLGAILLHASPGFGEWLRDRKNRRKIPHRLEQCGYVPVRNDAVADGYWVVNRKRVPIYAQRELPLREQIAAADRLTSEPQPTAPPPPLPRQ